MEDETVVVGLVNEVRAKQQLLLEVVVRLQQLVADAMTQRCFQRARRRQHERRHDDVVGSRVVYRLTPHHTTRHFLSNHRST